MESLSTDHASLKVSSSRAERELAAERGLTDQLQKELEAVKGRADSSAKKVSSLSKRVPKLEGELKECIESLTKSRKEVSSLNVKLEHSKSELRSTQQSYESQLTTEREIRAKLEEHVAASSQQHQSSSSANHSPLISPRKYAMSNASNHSFKDTPTQHIRNRSSSGGRDSISGEERDSVVPLPALSSHGLYRQNLSTLGSPANRHFAPFHKRRDSSISDMSELPFEIAVPTSASRRSSMSSDITSHSRMMNSSFQSAASSTVGGGVQTAFASDISQNLLRAELRHKDGEIRQLKHELHNMRQSERTLSNSLVAAKSELQKINSKGESAASIRAEYEATKLRYDAALEVIGEKEQEIEELKEEMKEIQAHFKKTVSDLLTSSKSVKGAS